MFEYENKYLEINNKFIAGIDEAGRGPLAGPVVCACVIMPLDKESIIEGVNDSKKLTEKQREELFNKIMEKAIDVSISFVSEKTIDEINILNATKLGMKNCLNELKIKPDVVLIDAVKLDVPYNTESINKGDELSYSIACASIVAKVSRDKFMCDLDQKYPNYNFKQHKGYATKEHISKLIMFGPSEVHRTSFIKNFVGKA